MPWWLARLEVSLGPSRSSLQRLENEVIHPEDDEDFLPDDAEGERSDDEYGNLSPAVRALMQKYEYSCCLRSPTGCSYIVLTGYKVTHARGQLKKVSDSVSAQ